MIDQLFNMFSFAGKEGALFIISMVPIVELRGAIPFGAALGMEWWKVFIISVVSNCIPIPFILMFGKSLLNWFKKTKLLSKLVIRWEESLMKKHAKIEKYSDVGLCIFTAIPLPGTGAWSAAVIATLLGLRMKRVFLFIALGVVIAGVIMTLASYGVANAVIWISR